MIFNLQKNNTRNSIDIGDFRSFCLTLANTSKYLDRPTLAVIVEILDFISKAFDYQHPQNNILQSIEINQYSLKKALRKVYEQNKKLTKKKSTIELEELAPPPNPDDITLNAKQLKQIEELLKPLLKEVQTTIQTSLLEVAKKILGSIEKPVEPAPGPEPGKKKGTASASKKS